ncbi:hypothetical protein J6590_027865 [Homalodisca vitripennis]|nr:hypothetical protein J6590_027865 [Homalodisca vitripennis]
MSSTNQRAAPPPLAEPTGEARQPTHGILNLLLLTIRITIAYHKRTLKFSSTEMSSSPHIDVCSSPERVVSPAPASTVLRCCPTKTSEVSDSKSSSAAYTSFSISSILSRGEPERRDNPLDVAHLAAAALHPCNSDSAMLSRYG